MRKFKRLNKVESRQLSELFPYIDRLYAIEDVSDYKHLSISVFDHWLSLEEAREEIDRVSAEKESSNNQKLYNFCCALASENECYLIKRLGMKKTDITFRAFNSQQDCLKCLEPMPSTYSRNGRFALAFPKMEFIYFEDWDFTHHIYYKNPEKLETLRAQVEKHSVYILEHLS